jgi:hypothetical protein
MSSLLVQFDLETKTVNYVYDHDNYYWCDLHFGFKCDNGPVVIAGGHICAQWGDQELVWPPEGETALTTEQLYVVSGVAFAPPGEDFVVAVKYVDDTKTVEDFHSVERPIPPAPFPSWVWDSSTYQWVAPVPMPYDETHSHEWDEENQSWIAKPLNQAT